MIPDLPEGWHATEVHKLFACWGGMTPSTSMAAYWGGKIPWVSSKDVKTWTIDGGTEFITQKALAETRLRKCRRGIVLVVVRSGVLAHTLPVAVTTQEVVVNQDVKALDSGDDGLNEWLAHYLRAREREILETNRKDGTTVQSIRVEELLQRDIPVAPAAEQRRIVAKVEGLLEQVNRAKDRLATLPRMLQRLRQAVLTAACSGRLTEEWRRAAGALTSADTLAIGTPTNDLDDVREHLDGLELPRGWITCRVDAIAAIQNGRAFPSKDYQAKGVRLVRPGNLHVSGRVEWTENNTEFLPVRWTQEASDFLLGQRELLMNLTAQSLKDEFLGRVCLKSDSIPALLNQRIARIRPLGAFDVRPYLFMYFKSMLFRAFINGLDTGSLIRHMHSKDVARHLIPLPPPEEQLLIVKIVRRFMNLAEMIERQVEVAINKTEMLPQSILSKAFSGELVPTEAELARAQGREYESASQLVARLAKAAADDPVKTTRVRRRKQIA